MSQPAIEKNGRRALSRSAVTLPEPVRTAVNRDVLGRDPTGLADAYHAVRRQTEELCQPLEIEDFVIQSMPDASPVKWHLAHTTWFFETFLLDSLLPDYRPFHPQFRILFNSYYNGVGARWPRPERGLLSRPTVAEVFAYRAQVDDAMRQLLERDPTSRLAELRSLLLLGLNHEQQHQELIVTDLKHMLAANPLHPVYREWPRDDGPHPPSRWLSFPAGLRSIGHDDSLGAGEDFAYDNESPRHTVYLPAHQIQSRLVTNAEYLEFIADNGYTRPELWLSQGWTVREAGGWRAPLYWLEDSPSNWVNVTLGGERPVEPDEPVCHVSFFEADAYARWAGARLPTEPEWEAAARELAPVLPGQLLPGHFLDAGRFHPSASAAPDDAGPLFQLCGDVWQWTASPYVGYPGYRPATGALGEYNGKFMCNQFVLRGASCATPRSHARVTYRNFFPPEARWQFTGLRLAKDV